MAKNGVRAFKEKQEKAYRDRIAKINARNNQAMREAVRDYKSNNPPKKSKKSSSVPSVWEILFG